MNYMGKETLCLSSHVHYRPLLNITGYSSYKNDEVSVRVCMNVFYKNKTSK